MIIPYSILKIGCAGFFRLLMTLGLWFSSLGVLAEHKTLCVFDLLGANGPVYDQMKDYQIAAIAWGVDFRLKPYLSERKAAADFKSGLCDAVSITGTQSRQFNSFSGTLDAMGALPSYDALKMVINAISSEQAAPLMSNGLYEVAGVIPVGAAYLFVNDRSLVLNQVDKTAQLASIKVAIMDSDPAQSELIKLIGATSVGSTIAGMYRKFNEGRVNATYGPAVVYEAMELHKGLNDKGGVIRFPIAQLTLQIIIQQAKFHQSFGQHSRLYSLNQFDKAVKLARNFEDRIAMHWWIDISEDDQQRYHEMYRKTRLSLRKKGIYDDKMLRLMRITRCKKAPDRLECTADDRE